MIKVIDRRIIATTGVREEVVRRSDGQVYAEQTRDVRGGTMSRRTGLYADDQAYATAKSAGHLAWSTWE